MKRGLWWKIPLIAIVGWFAVTFFYGFFSRDIAVAFVTCDSGNAKDTLRQAFDQSQVARQNNVSAIEVSEASELEYRDTLIYAPEAPHIRPAHIRVCKANVTMNNTQVLKLKFRMEYRSDGTYMLVFWDAASEEPSKPIELGK